MKESMSTNKFMEILKKESPSMSDIGEALLGNVDSMNQMHQQAMRNSFSMMGQMFPWFSHLTPPQTPEMASIREMMPDAESMMPEMQEMAQNMQDMMTNAPILMEGMTRAMLPVFQQRHVQMLSNMNKMNRMAFERTRRFHEQNNEMAKRWFGMTMKTASAELDETEEAEDEFDGDEDAE